MHRLPSWNVGSRAMLGVILCFSLTGIHLMFAADCPDRAANEEAAQYCDGPVQFSCGQVLNAQYCNGNKKLKERVTLSCTDHEGTACLEQQDECWTEYVCIWDSNDDECDNSVVVGTSTILQKITGICADPQ